MILLPILLALPGVHAFIGLGVSMYDSICTDACRRVLNPIALECPPHLAIDHSAHASGGGHRHHVMPGATPACRAQSEVYLFTLAHCARQSCAPDAQAPSNVMTIERYWAKEITGEPGVLPMWSYGESLGRLGERELQRVFTARGFKGVLNETVVLDPKEVGLQISSQLAFERQEMIHARFGFIIFCVALGLPVLLTALNFFPPVHQLFLRLKPYVVYPAIRGRFARPVLSDLRFPLTGHAIYLSVLFLVNIIFISIEYHVVLPHSFLFTTKRQLLAWINNRTGVLAIALLPLTFIFAGRNHLLLYLTNWSHGTYILVHRWVARMFVLQVLLHSVCELVLHLHIGDYPTQLPTQYWIWGCVATVACSIMVIAAYARARAYEVFLVTHIVLAVFVLVGTWFHIEELFQRERGYAWWMYITFGVWGYERVARVVRMFGVGTRYASVVAISEGVLRIDVPGVRWAVEPGQHAFVYFPSVRWWTAWENHPFSAIPTALLAPRSLCASGRADPESTEPSTPDLEKSLALAPPVSANTNTSTSTTAGLTFFVRRFSGSTGSLPISSRLFTLLEGPYRSSHHSSLLRSDRLLLFTNGVGITATLPYLSAHTNAKLIWSVRADDAALVEAIAPAIESAEKSVSVGKRNDVCAMLRQEAEQGWGVLGVMVCGHADMCDEIRAIVVELGRTGVCIELEVEAQSW